MNQALFLAQRRDGKIALMLIDLEGFRQVNDLYGHAAGDAALREVAQRLAGCVRRADTLARCGADEFAIVVTEVRREADCQVVAERVLRALAAEISVKERAIALSASIGISIFPADAGDGEALLRNAGAAVDRARQAGRNQYRFYAK